MNQMIADEESYEDVTENMDSMNISAVPGEAPTIRDTSQTIDEPETVASHMYRMAVLAMTLDGQIPGIDASDVSGKSCSLYKWMLWFTILAKLSLVDITPHCGIGKENKLHWKLKLCNKLPLLYRKTLGLTGLAYHLDKFDMIAQAFDYEQKYGIDLHEFFTSTVGKLKMEPFVSWDTELRAKRADWIPTKK
ncbi:unnamed protein product, partial [Mesorhabditis belari]|uniref:Uncharacterized protein n=1 Tax=Mesorhabditis belari TaxID=2138241 RepID=A0AAF3FLV3_9BILA